MVDERLILLGWVLLVAANLALIVVVLWPFEDDHDAIAAPFGDMPHLPPQADRLDRER